jgi:hypothetical protein
MARKGFAVKALTGLKALEAAAEKAAKARKLKERPKYSRTEQGGTLRVQREGVAPQTVPGLETASIGDIRKALRDPKTNPALRVARQYTKETQGRDYDFDRPAPKASLGKQSGIARTFSLAASEDPAYKQAIFEAYGKQMPDVVERLGAQNYDQLTEGAYRKLAGETQSQFDRLPVSTSYHFGEKEYPQPSAMLRDVLGEGNLNVFRGGDPHPYLSDIDPATGLSANEQFRAVHDYFGHGIQGATFRPGGEEAAYASHAQMMSPEARMALLSETRGQNSWINFGPANADVILQQNRLRRALQDLEEANRIGLNSDGTYIGNWGQQAERARAALPGGDPKQAAAQLRELAASYQYAPQQPLLLPPEYLDVSSPGGMPSYVKELIKPAAPTGVERGVHFSAAPGLSMLDPKFFGSANRGADYRSGLGNRGYMYLGDEGTITPEVSLFDRPRTAYEGQVSGLYDTAADPEGLVKLYNAWNAVGGTRLGDLDTLAKQYGYKGQRGKIGDVPVAALYESTPVEAISDLLTSYPAGRRFAAGGSVSVGARHGS